MCVLWCVSWLGQKESLLHIKNLYCISRFTQHVINSIQFNSIQLFFFRFNTTHYDILIQQNVGGLFFRNCHTRYFSVLVTRTSILFL